MKEDDVDRDKRHESAEKQKSTKDLENKKEKKKNLERQALEKRRAKSRQRGESEEESPDEDDGNDGDGDSDDSEGMAARLDKILEGPPQADVDVAQMGDPKKASGIPHDGQRRESSPSRSHATTPPATAPGRSVSGPRPPPSSGAGHWVKSTPTGPLTCGRVAASSQGETGRRSSSPGAHQARDAELRPTPARERLGVSTWGGSKPAGRGAGRRVALCLVYSRLRLSSRYSCFFRLKRPLEQAQPSMAKKLKVGAAPRDLGEWSIFLSMALELYGPYIELLSG